MTCDTCPRPAKHTDVDPAGNRWACCGTHAEDCCNRYHPGWRVEPLPAPDPTLPAQEQQP